MPFGLVPAAKTVSENAPVDPANGTAHASAAVTTQAAVLTRATSADAVAGFAKTATRSVTTNAAFALTVATDVVANAGFAATNPAFVTTNAAFLTAKPNNFMG